MKLEVRVYDTHAATIETSGGQHYETGLEALGPGIGRLSAAWEDDPGGFDLWLWLDDCLPENGQRLPYVEQAARMLMEHGQRPAPNGPGDLLWGNTEAEYAGAVSFRRGEDERSAETGQGYARLSDEEIAQRLESATQAANAGPGRPRSYRERRTSLSGMRPKIGLTPLDGGWGAATGGSVNGCVAKVEMDPNGEAGMEAIAQRAVNAVGVRAARTLTRTFGGFQTVLSWRSDRERTAGREGLKARHQEEFSQATGWPGSMKYEGGTRQEPRWEALYALLQRKAADPEAETHRVTRFLAASWLLGHGDLHRRNVGILHSRATEPMSVELAPAYDVSSSVGVGKLEDELAIGIARQRRYRDIGPVQWLEHARTYRLNADVTLAIVRDVAKRMPQALAQARTEARTEDENRFRAAVERRVEKTIRYSEGAGRDFEATLHRMHSKGARGQNERVRTAGAGPKAAREKMPEGRRRIHDDGE